MLKCLPQKPSYHGKGLAIKMGTLKKYKEKKPLG